MGKEDNIIFIWYDKDTNELFMEISASGQVFKLDIGEEITGRSLTDRIGARPLAEINLTSRIAYPCKVFETERQKEERLAKERIKDKNRLSTNKT